MPLPNISLFPQNGLPISHQGSPLEAGTQPAVIYFALSAHMSLFVDPFNQPVLRLCQQGIRVFSWDLPFHEAEKDPHDAMRQWEQEFKNCPSFIDKFIDQSLENIHYLIEQGFVNPSRLAVAGLSRGGFMAAHLAAREKRIKTVVGFAPLTEPKFLEDSQSSSNNDQKITLTSLVHHLLHTRLRFYIGNHDTRVSTDACYHFIQALTTSAFNQGIRSPLTELIIYPSIGYKGHGTPPFIFHDGADWITKHLLSKETA